MVGGYEYVQGQLPSWRRGGFVVGWNVTRHRGAVSHMATSRDTHPRSIRLIKSKSFFATERFTWKAMFWVFYEGMPSLMFLWKVQKLARTTERISNMANQSVLKDIDFIRWYCPKFVKVWSRKLWVYVCYWPWFVICDCTLLSVLLEKVLLCRHVLQETKQTSAGI